MSVRKFAAVAAAFPAAVVLSLTIVAGASAAPVFDGHFDVGRFSNNAKIVEGPDRNMWITMEDGGNDVARITLDGQVTKFAVGAVAAPTGIAPDAEGRLWLTYNGGVASFLPGDPTKADETPIVGIKAESSIVLGPDGRMWVATENSLIHFSPTDPSNPQPIAVAGLSPKDIDVAGPLLAVADQAGNRVVTVSTSGEQKSYPLDGQSQGVAGNPSGQIGFSQQSNMPTQVGVITPPGSPVTFELPTVDPFGVALGSDQAFWAARKGGAQRFTPAGESTFIGGAEDRFFVRQVGSGPNNTIWVTMLDPGTEDYEVGRISGLEPPVKPGGDGKPPPTAPETTIDKGPKKKVTIKGRAKRALVKFRFSSTTRGATFECALTKKPRKKGAPMPKPVFRACKSPGKLRLKPGRYRFSVRAVAGGLVDPTPASRGFRVVRAAPKRAP